MFELNTSWVDLRALAVESCCPEIVPPPLIVEDSSEVWTMPLDPVAKLPELPPETRVGLLASKDGADPEPPFDADSVVLLWLDSFSDA